MTEWGQDKPNFGASVQGEHFRVRTKPGPLAKRFVVEFTGALGLRAKRATIVHARLFPWEDHQISATTPSGRAVRLFINIDESPKTIATERLGKLLFRTLSEFATNSQVREEVHLLKYQGVVTFDWASVAKVVPHADKMFTLYWNLQAVSRLQIHKPTVASRLAELSNSGPIPGDFSWSH